LNEPESAEGGADNAWLSYERAFREIAPDPKPRLPWIFGASITSLAAGPTVIVIAVLQFYLSPEASFGATPSLLDIFSGIVKIAGGVLYLGTIYGLVSAIPAAIVNASASTLLARRGWDSPWIALICGILVGLTIPDLPDVAYRLSNGDTLKEAISQRVYAGFWVSFGIAGGLMGLLNWWLVIRPLRRWRSARSEKYPLGAP
jgi:hypothetical protein